MKSLYKISIFAAILCIAFSCKDEDAQFNYLGEPSYSIGRGGGTIPVPVSTTVAYSVTAAEGWCTIAGKNAIGFDIVAEANSTINPRSCEITVTGMGFDPVKVTVSQDSGERIFTVAEAEKQKTFTKDGGTQMLRLTANVEYTAKVVYDVTPAESWCSITGKNQQGFNINVEFNGVTEPRSCKVVIEADGFADIEITVSQAKGIPYLTINEPDMTLSFETEGGSKTVSLSTNLTDYTVIPDKTWCVVSDKSASGFKVTVDPNTGMKQSATLTISGTGIDDVIITVKQDGESYIKNGNFASGLDHWTARGTPNAFEITTYLINGVNEKTVSRTWGVRFTNFQSSLVQKITGISDGTYTLSCMGFAAIGDGTDPGDTEFNLISIDKNDVETRYSMPVVSGMGRKEAQVTVTGGEISVGFEIKGIETKGVFFNVGLFDLE